ncbi:MAG: MotA/TolQ/ExbB proton channel family protein [Halieaceae bacterium]|jgi:biopolymer transport protein ExbB|nr:MotA/TolQ/ExbB proton channel family protein [Halieaceae bacterium]
MSALIEAFAPWLGDLLELGGPILGIILCIAFVMWLLLFERVYYMLADYPRDLAEARAAWEGRFERRSWFAEQQRNALVGQIASRLTRHFSLIGTLIKVCPLLGLLGTVVGMLEVFDALAATGSNNPRSMAAGVSKATVSTLAGMVVAIVGLLALSLSERRAVDAREKLPVHFPQMAQGQALLAPQEETPGA